jgi:hypothetical protein
MSDFTVYKPRNGQILKKGRVMSASDLAVELTQLQATNERLIAERDESYSVVDMAVSSYENDDGNGFAWALCEAEELLNREQVKRVLANQYLEQQAKGVDRVLELQAYSCMNESAIMAQDIHGLLASLRNQAKQAKEKG